MDRLTNTRIAVIPIAVTLAIAAGGCGGADDSASLQSCVASYATQRDIDLSGGGSTGFEMSSDVHEWRMEVTEYESVEAAQEAEADDEYSSRAGRFLLTGDVEAGAEARIKECVG